MTYKCGYHAVGQCAGISCYGGVLEKCEMPDVERGRVTEFHPECLKAKILWERTIRPYETDITQFMKKG